MENNPKLIDDCGQCKFCKDKRKHIHRTCDYLNQQHPHLGRSTLHAAAAADAHLRQVAELPLVASGT